MAIKWCCLGIPSLRMIHNVWFISSLHFCIWNVHYYRLDLCLFFFFTAHQSWLLLNFHVSCDAFIFFFFFYTSAAFSQRSKQRLSKELSDCVVYCKSVHFRSFKHSRIHSKFYEVTSFTESKARKHLREAGKSSLTESHSFLGRTLHVFTTENYLCGNAAELLWVNFPSKHYASASRIQYSNVSVFSSRQ